MTVFQEEKGWKTLFIRVNFNAIRLKTSKLILYCLLVLKSHVQTKISLIPVLDRVKVFEIKDTTVLLASGVFFLEWQSQL